jgi:hypothetical protein
MKPFLFLLILFAFHHAHAQSYAEELKHYRDSTITELFHENVIMVDSAELSSHVRFYRPKPEYIVQARFERDTIGDVFVMKTTTNRQPKYYRYGWIHFTLDSKPLTLAVYGNARLEKMPLYKNYLFCPFKDLTNADSTYGGGRYIDLRKNKIQIDSVVVDFNRSYNPYCAYNYKYSCPIPPKENHLKVRIDAGVMRPTEVH